MAGSEDNPDEAAGEAPDDDQGEAAGEAPDVDALIEDLKASVDERRRSGAYPPGLEDDLEAHFQRVAAHRVHVDTGGALDASLQRLAAVPGPDRGRIDAASDIPGGAALHRLVARLVTRQTEGVLAQVADITAALRDVVEELARTLRRGDSHSHDDLLGIVDALHERLASIDRAPRSEAVAMAALERRLERLERAEARRRFRPTFTAREFEAAFRGTEEQIRDRYRPLAARLAGHAPVLDVGCGRGEMLELLREAGVEARGVEVDEDLAGDARSRGLDVTVGDAVEVLGALPDGSLGGLVTLQVLEHLSPQQLVTLVALTSEKVRPGGLVVAETLNPQSLYVFTHAFFLDPTHAHLVHPAYLSFLFRKAGFASVETEWRSPPPQPELLVPTGDASDANWEKLNRTLFGPQDYAVVAVR